MLGLSRLSVFSNSDNLMHLESCLGKETPFSMPLQHAIKMHNWSIADLTSSGILVIDFQGKGTVAHGLKLEDLPTKILTVTLHVWYRNESIHDRQNSSLM